ncbi:MAG: TetR/AcrR family transcriptional regulator [Oscillospiraceae bacterium]|nr:TetR/AcrR family transcriptional regulator [Oscillospiraceae bacterium]
MPTAIFNRLKDEKKQRIINAAIKEFSLRNISEAKILNISKDAEIANGSIYQYFSTKDDLYVYIIQFLRDKRTADVNQAFELYKKAPFFDFYEEFYIRDSEYLFRNPLHVEVGKQMYSSSNPVAKNLVYSQQIKYRDCFLIGIEHDKDRGIINRDVDSGILAEICTYLLTNFLFAKTPELQLSIDNIQEHCRKTVNILRNGAAITCK